MLQYRRHVRWQLPFWLSIFRVERELVSLAHGYNPEVRPPLFANVQFRPVLQDLNLHTAFPVSGTTPLGRKAAFYNNEKNSFKFAFRRRHECVGALVFLESNSRGYTSQDRRCAVCGKGGAAYYCVQCRVFLHHTSAKCREIRCVEASGKVKIVELPTKRNSEGEQAEECKSEEEQAERTRYFLHTCSNKWHERARLNFYRPCLAGSLPDESKNEMLTITTFALLMSLGIYISKAADGMWKVVAVTGASPFKAEDIIVSLNGIQLKPIQNYQTLHKLFQCFSGTEQKVEVRRLRTVDSASSTTEEIVGASIDSSALSVGGDGSSQGTADHG